MTGRDFDISAGHDIRIQSKAAGITTAVFLSEFFEHRKVVKIETYSEIDSLNHFVKFNATGSEVDLTRSEAGPQRNVRFLYRHDIYPNTVLFHQLKNGNVRQRFCCEL